MSVAVAAFASQPVRLPLAELPRTRAGCGNVPRPCPHTSCYFHLEIERRGPVPPDAPTCTLDVADAGGATLEAVAILLGITRERVRQIQAKALAKLGVTLRRRSRLRARDTLTVEDVRE